MTILINAETKVVVHGSGGSFARAQMVDMQAAGTCVVAGVSVGNAGKTTHGLPVFDTVAEAVKATGANTSAIYLPAPAIRDAVIENADAGIKTAFVTAEHVPVHDALYALAYARSKSMWVIGPNSLGLSAPCVGMLGAMQPASSALCLSGPVGLMSRSGSLACITSHTLSKAGIHQNVCVHIGGDIVVGRNPAEYLEAFAADPATRVIVYCGEVGGAKEYDMIERLPRIDKPLVAMIVGRSAPPGKRMGHAGALVGAARESAQAKRAALRAAGAYVADSPMHMADIIKSIL
ncbi:MAG: succinate--CoA ligase subunit alpha [Smithellaceae bacterium]